jgi:hypothetical protein
MSATGNMLYTMLVATGLAGSATLQVIPMLPRPEAGDYFEVRSVTAERQGDTAILHVDREINRPDAIMPHPVTLEWWTNGACDALPAGHIEIETTWDPIVPDFDPVSVTTGVE